MLMMPITTTPMKIIIVIKKTVAMLKPIAIAKILIIIKVKRYIKNKKIHILYI